MVVRGEPHNGHGLAIGSAARGTRKDADRWSLQPPAHLETGDTLQEEQAAPHCAAAAVAAPCAEQQRHGGLAESTAPEADDGGRVVPLPVLSMRIGRCTDKGSGPGTKPPVAGLLRSRRGASRDPTTASIFFLGARCTFGVLATPTLPCRRKGSSQFSQLYVLVRTMVARCWLQRWPRRLPTTKS